MQQGGSALDRMNQILSEKESVIDNKMKRLEAYEKELKAYESELVVKTQEVQAQIAAVKEENARIDARWKELKGYETNLENSMANVLEEKVKLEVRSKELLEQSLEKEENSAFGALNLNELRASVGIEIPVREEAEEAAGKEENVPNFGTTEIAGTGFAAFEEVIRKKYPRWSLLEQTKDMYCLQIPNQRELRIFLRKPPLMEIQIVIFHKNAYADKRLQSANVAISRIMTDWDFVCEENHYAWCYRFTNDMDPSVVLKTCSDFMKKHL